jgi:hypothetical protein
MGDEALGETRLGGEWVGGVEEVAGGDEWESGSVLLGHTYRRYRDVLHVGCTLDPHGAANEKAAPELRAVSLLLRCAAAAAAAAAAAIAMVHVHAQRLSFAPAEEISVARWVLHRPSNASQP